MKSAWKYFVSLIDGFARARAATELSRAGRHDLAKQLMLKD